jgi:murein DD-endopeptidase MepM/ murein hydrolase activator NlpD
MVHSDRQNAHTPGGGRSPLSLFLWGIAVAVLAAGAYVGGAGLANRWVGPSRALPAPDTPTPPADWLAPGIPVESQLTPAAPDVWQFEAQQGQSITLEMWFHPGSGSGLDAELTAYLIGPDGAVLTQESGSLFLPPYLVATELPAGGVYRVQVVPTAGEPGRYSLALAVAEPATEPAAGTVVPHPTAAAEGYVEGITTPRFQWPSSRRAISGWTFHDPRNPGHIGLDIAARMWDPIVAIADGVVVFADWGGGYGNLVVVQHGEDWISYYAHLEEFAVEEGQAVRQGELLGGAGSTGYSTGPHLHFEIRYKGRPVDPHVHLP